MTNTAINFINDVNTNAQRTFRNLAAIGFTYGLGLTGRTFVQYTGDKATKATVLPEGLTFGLKFVAMKNVDRKNEHVLGGFMLTRNRLDTVVPLALLSAIPTNIDFPQDSHLRWRTSDSPTKKGTLYGYLVHGVQILEIETDQLGLDSKCVDMQVVFAAGVYNVHLLTEKGTVFETKIKPVDIVTNGRIAKFHKLKDGVTALLTVPQKGEMIAYYGTAQGVYFGNQLVKGTEDLNVSKLVVDSENPRIFARTIDGKIYAIPVDNNFLPIGGKLITIDDKMQTNEDFFAGPAIQINDQTVALLAINWDKQNDGFYYQERAIAIPQLPLIPTIINPRL